MKNNQVTFILVGVFLLSAFSAAWLGQKYNSAFKQDQEAELLLARMKYTQFVATQLLNETVEFSKKDPAIQPLIQAATNSAVPPSNAKPAAKQP